MSREMANTFNFGNEKRFPTVSVLIKSNGLFLCMIIWSGSSFYSLDKRKKWMQLWQLNRETQMSIVSSLPLATEEPSLEQRLCKVP